MQIVYLDQDKVTMETQAQLYPNQEKIKLQEVAQAQEASFNKFREVTDKDDIGKNVCKLLGESMRV